MLNMRLYICLKDGKVEVEINDYHEFEIDWKYPKRTYVYDEKHERIGGDMETKRLFY